MEVSGINNKEIIKNIETIAEKFLLLDWDDKKQIDAIYKILNTLQKTDKDPEIIKQLISLFKNTLENGKEPEKEEKIEIGNLIEQLHTNIVEGEETAKNVIKIEDEDQELYEIFLIEAIENLDSIERDIIKLEKDPQNVDLIKSIFRSFHTIKGVAASYQFNNVSELSHKLENLLDVARDEKITIKQNFITIILTGVDILRAMLGEAEKGIKTKKIIIKKTDITDISYNIDQYIKENEKQEKKTDTDPVSKKGGETKKKSKIDKIDTAQIGQALSNFIKISTKKMDLVINTVGELVIIENMLSLNDDIHKLEDKNIERSLIQLKRITRTLQDAALTLRMVPINETFIKMQRVVRDYATQYKKEINLITSGEETEIDRNMVEAIYEPLVHLIRNSCDHAIENSEERKINKKNKNGLIELSAYYKGRNIIVEITDDGRGLDKDAILKRAIEKGLIQKDAKLSEKEIYRLIFFPGFSTAKKVTSVSGRGVGMDVVLKAVNRLRGKVEIDTVKGKGTTVSMVLPLTLAIIDGMVVRVGTQRFVIPTESIKKTFQPTDKEYTRVANRGEMIIYNEKLLNLVKIKDIFSINECKQDPWDAIIIVVEGIIKDYCLMVDEIMGKQEIVIKNLGEYFKDTKGIAGGTILSDGKVGLIIDVFDLSTIFK